VRITPDSARIVYINYFESEGIVYRSDIDGSNIQLLADVLDHPLDRIDRIELSSTGLHVVFETHEHFQPDRIYAVPLAGGPPVRLTPPTTHAQLDGWKITPDGTCVIYRRHADQTDRWRLFSVPIVGGTPVELSPTQTVPGSDVEDFDFVPGTNVVVMRADYRLLGRPELYSVPYDGSQPADFLGPAGTEGDGVRSLQVSADGQYVVFVDDRQAGFANDDLFSLPLDGSMPAVQLNDASSFFAPHEYAIAGDYVFHLTSGDGFIQEQLFRRRIDGSDSLLRLSPSGHPNSCTLELHISPDGAHVVFRGDHDTLNKVEIYSVPVDASTASVRLTPASLGYSDALSPVITPDSTRVLFALDAQVNEAYGVFSAPIDGSTAALEIGAAAESFEDRPEDLLVTSDSQRVLYRAEQFEPVGNLGRSLHSAPVAQVGGDIILNGGFPLQPRGRVEDFQIASAGNRVAYRMGWIGELELYTADVTGRSPGVRLGEDLPTGLVMEDYRFTASGQYVLFRYCPTVSPGVALFAQDSQGQAPEYGLSDLFDNKEVVEFQVFGEDVVYLSRHLSTGQTDLFHVPADGSSPATRLNPVLPAGQQILDFEIDPSGARVVYRADQDTPFQLELYSVPLTGGTVTRINAPLIPEGDVAFPNLYNHGSKVPYGFSPNGAWVVYMADQVLDEQVTLYGVRIDGSEGPYSLQPTMVAGGSVRYFEVTPGGGVVYVADQNTAGVYELFSCSLNGVVLPIPLSGPMVQGGDIRGVNPFEAEEGDRSFFVTPDGLTVVYQADQELNGTDEFYRVSIAGGGATKLSATVPTGRGEYFRLSPDGAFAVYVVRLEDGGFELYSAPTDASAHAELLTTVPDNSAIRSLFIDPTSRYVVAEEFLELFAWAIDGSEPERRLAAHGPGFFETFKPAMTQDGERLLYLSNPLDERYIELYATYFERGPAPRSQSPEDSAEAQAP